MDVRKLQEVVEDRGAWRATVHGVVKSQRWLSNETTAIGSCSSWYHFRPYPVYLFIYLGILSRLWKFHPTPPVAFLEYVCVLIRSILSSSLCPHVFSLLGSCVHEFSRQEYGSGLPFPPPGDLPNSGIKLLSLASPAWAGQPFTSQSVSSVAQLCPTLRRYGLQHARLPCPSPTPGACSNSSIESVMPSNHLILCHPLLLPPSIFPSIMVFSNESALHIR